MTGRACEPPAPVAAALVDGERVLALWRPVFARFAAQGLGVGIAGALLFIVFSPAHWRVWLALALPLAVVWGLVFDDWASWLVRRRDRWVLTDRRLWFWNPLEAPEPASVELVQIAGAGPLALVSVTLHLRDGAHLALPCLPRPQEIRRAILAARDKAAHRS